MFSIRDFKKVIIWRKYQGKLYKGEGLWRMNRGFLCEKAGRYWQNNVMYKGREIWNSTMSSVSCRKNESSGQGWIKTSGCLIVGAPTFEHTRRCLTSIVLGPHGDVGGVIQHIKIIGLLLKHVWELVVLFTLLTPWMSDHPWKKNSSSRLN